MSNFLKSQIANLALAVELSVLGAVIVFMITASLGVSPTTVKREWAIAKAWLLHALEHGAARDPADG